MVVNSPSYYISIHKLPLNIFIDVACDSNLDALIISGNPSAEELAKAWEEISEQYNNAMTSGTIETAHTISLYRNVIRTDFKLKAAESFINILKEVYVKRFADEVNKIVGTRLEFDVLKTAEYENDLKRALLRLTGLKIRLEFEKSKLSKEVEKKEPTENKQLTREYFTNLIINLSDHAGYEIKEAEISVYKFCERIRRYNRLIDQMKMTEIKNKSVKSIK